MLLISGESHLKSNSSASGKAGHEYKSGCCNNVGADGTPALATVTALIAAILTQS